MRENSKVRERFELSLDGRQVAAVVVGALVLLGAVFVLGLNVGRQSAAAPPPARPENPLAALDQSPRGGEPRGTKEPKLSYHDALTKGPPEAAPLPEPRAAPPSAARAAEPVPAAAAPPREAVREAAPPTPAPRDPVAAAVAKVQALQPKAAPPAPAAGGVPGRFAVQVGASQTEAEALRLARRHEADGARVVAAELPGKGRVYRVKLGSFATRDEAEQLLAALGRRGVKGFVTDAR